MADILSAITSLKSEMADMKKDMAQERQAADERLIKRIKLDPTPTFKKKGNEKQRKINSQVEEKLMSVSAALQETPPPCHRKSQNSN